jgi:putative ABC transport system substrate-binding protein
MAQRRIGALAVTADGFLIGRRDQIVGLASRYAVPTMYPLVGIEVRRAQP